MRVGHVQPGRPAYFDRTPTFVTQHFGASTLAPHAATTRWTYTVTAAKKAYLQLIRGLVMRVTAAAPVGLAESFVQYTPNGGALTTILDSMIQTNNVGDRDRETTTNLGLMGALDVVIGKTVDLSTGGTVLYELDATAVEFDA